MVSLLERVTERRHLRVECYARIVSAAGALALVVLFGIMLGVMSSDYTVASRGDGRRVQLIFVERVVSRPDVDPYESSTAGVPTVAKHVADPSEHPLGEHSSALSVEPRPSSPLSIYDNQGRIRLPEHLDSIPANPDPAPSATGRGIEMRGRSDISQGIENMQRWVAEAILGKDIEHAQARKSPEVAFNPALQEELSSATAKGEKSEWASAPVRYESPPGLSGLASRAIRERVGDLEQRYSRCSPSAISEAISPVLNPLGELQAAEAAMARGADPVRTEHMLPNTANRAYDQARRMLWLAERKLEGCAVHVPGSDS